MLHDDADLVDEEACFSASGRKLGCGVFGHSDDEVLADVRGRRHAPLVASDLSARADVIRLELAVAVMVDEVADDVLDAVLVERCAAGVGLGRLLRDDRVDAYRGIGAVPLDDDIPVNDVLRVLDRGVCEYRIVDGRKSGFRRECSVLLRPG